MSDWTYNSKVWNPTEDELKSLVGFVYCVTDLENGKKYIGKKTLFSRTKRPPLKGQKRKRIIIKESNWRNYCGSSEEVKRLVNQDGLDRFKREILYFCKSKGMLSYMELKEQVEREVLFKPEEYYNAFIGCKIHRKHVLKK